MPSTPTFLGPLGLALFLWAQGSFCSAWAVPAPAGSGTQAACCGAITTQGQALAAALDAMHLDRLWLAREHVDWRTGEPDRAATYVGPGRATHCSAFASAVGLRLGVYLLRPPQHSQILLASAQTAWFHSQPAYDMGWRPLAGPNRAQEAQSLANRGALVMIAYESANPHTPGHIVIVRPSEKSLEALDQEGPEVAEAGTKNYADFNAAKSFTHHKDAWPDGVRYYWHPVDWSKISH